MPRIRQLSHSVITKISAGEVIERPASVVKELVENSLDAGSTRIDIELEQGGIERICVVDNGCGMEPEDLPLAFTSHATSKLADADDLFRIATLGFRGEALASVGGIAKVSLQSRPPANATGAELHCDGGDLSPIRPWNGSPGTRIDVRHLFFNTPVRKKFLKANATELGHASEMITKLALANPNVHFSLKHNGRLVFDIPPTATLADRIGLFFGKDVAKSLYEIDTGEGDVRLWGSIADPNCDRGNARLQYLFVNGRWFRDRSLGHAVQEAYRGLLMTGRFAVTFLFLEVSPEMVDVNVHPTKAEVKFRDASGIYSLVRSAVKKRLIQENWIPRLEPMKASSPTEEFNQQLSTPMMEPPLPSRWVVPPPESNTPRLPFAPPPPVADVPIPINRPMNKAEANTPLPPQPTAVEDVLPSLLSMSKGTAIQIHDAYLVLETDEGMLVIDQHALHERILFEQLQTRIRDGKLEVQRLLIPEPVELPFEQAAIVVEMQDALAELGLEVSDFGGNTVLLSSYPSLLSRRSAREIFAAVVDELVTKDRPPSKEQLLHNLMATMACKAAVKAGDKLDAEEIAYLLKLRTMAEDSHHCPHGRPTSLSFSRRDLDKQFKRT